MQSFRINSFLANYADLSYWNILSWIPSSMYFLFFFVRAIGVLPVMHTLAAELFPTEIRTQSIGVVESITLATGAIAIKLFPNLKDLFGIFGLCCMYSGFSVFLIFWGALTIPDNRGKSLVKVEEMYEKTNIRNHKSSNKSVKIEKS